MYSGSNSVVHYEDSDPWLEGVFTLFFFATQCVIVIFYNMIVSRAVYHILERLWEVERTLPAVLSH